MKNLIFILSAVLLIASCQPQDPEAEKMAMLSEKKSTLSEKKAQLKTLQSEIEALSKEISNLEPQKEKAPLLVTTEDIETEKFVRYTEVQASVMNDDEVFVSSETGGRLLNVLVKEGQYVKKGQLIATVDLKALTDQKAELETSMSLAKDVYERQKKLWDQNIGSEVQFLQAKNNYERLQKSLNTLETQIAKANVYSPISGVVDKEFLKAGEMAKFTAKGSLVNGEAVVNTWYEIWKADIDRSFTTDFEVYDERSENRDHAEVDIFIALNSKK